MNLPTEFCTAMSRLLGDEYADFLASYNRSRTPGLRVNTLKCTAEQLCAEFPIELRPVPWADGGFYYPTDSRPGLHPYHSAGVYYMQEPSAMAVGAYSGVQGGERVLDLCAAPGGKSTHIAALMGGRGLLVSNEIHPARAKILSQNIERMGVTNAVVTNESPQRLAERLYGYFDTVIVDAPCSGEGMFVKEPQALEHWSLENVRLCAQRQLEILDSAQRMLRAGGRLVYSTCTFSPEENEGTISRFLEQNPDFYIEQTAPCEWFVSGIPDSVPNPAEAIERTMRLLPHRIDGEGHFIAVLRRLGDGVAPTPQKLPPVKDSSAIALFEEFAKSSLNEVPSGQFALFGEHLYLLPDGVFPFDGLRILRAGLELGIIKKNRFEPSHALALALKPHLARRSVNLSSHSVEVLNYLRGQSLNLPADTEAGWTLVTVDGFSLGWGKASSGTLKNHYPKGLRRL